VPLEREFGSIRIFCIYMLSGIAGNLMSSIFLPTVLSVGASGVIKSERGQVSVRKKGCEIGEVRGEARGGMRIIC
jgi:hypothetical protein